MAIKISLTQRHEAWHTITVPADDSTAEVRVQYHLLPEDELRRIRRAPLEGYEGRSQDMMGNVTALVDALSDERAEERKQLLVDRVLDWDIIDADTDKPLPVTEANIRALCAMASMFIPLYDGLLDASGAPVKKT